MVGIIQYRFSTAAMFGSWRDTRARAMQDALEAGLATVAKRGRGKIVLHHLVTIEERDEPGRNLAGMLGGAAAILSAQWLIEALGASCQAGLALPL